MMWMRGGRMILMPPPHATFRRREPAFRTCVLDPVRGTYRLEVRWPGGWFRRGVTMRAEVRLLRLADGCPVFVRLDKGGVIGPGDLGYVQLFFRAFQGAGAID